MNWTPCSVTLAVGLICSMGWAEDGWVHYAGSDGPGSGKNIVLISGDEEYRSEEALPMLAQILAVRHGFECTVLFSMSDDGTYIDPNNQRSLEGIEALKSADLMIIATRFRNPTDDAMKYIDDYLQQGKPVIGLRTATHGFAGLTGKYEHYNNGYSGDGPHAAWKDGFGRYVLGERWVNHHGQHGRQSTGGVIVPEQKNHPILRGVDEETIWGTSDVYGVRLPLPGDSKPLVLGAVLEGMNPGDPPISGAKNDPMMPVVWTKSYTSDSGNTGRVVNTTMGASEDFVQPGLRRVIVNAVYWALGMEGQIRPDANVDFVTEYKPSRFGFKQKGGRYWRDKHLKPSDYQLD